MHDFISNKQIDCPYDNVRLSPSVFLDKCPTEIIIFLGPNFLYYFKHQDVRFYYLCKYMYYFITRRSYERFGSKKALREGMLRQVARYPTIKIIYCSYRAWNYFDCWIYVVVCPSGVTWINFQFSSPKNGKMLKLFFVSAFL